MGGCIFQEDTTTAIGAKMSVYQNTVLNNYLKELEQHINSYRFYNSVL